MRVAVVGGGVVGLCCAYSLRRRGADVVLLERDEVGSGCTRGNTGWICPGLSAPLPAPGVMGAAVRGMLRPGSPVLIRPLFGLEFLRWTWRFWRACTPEAYRAGLEATVALSRRSFALFDELRAAGVEFEMHQTGMVVAALTEEGLREFEIMLRDAEAAGYEGPVDVLGREEVRRVERAVSDAVVGAVHAPSERYVRPESLARGLADWLRVNGAEVREGAEVRSLDEIEADAVVVAAGAWSGPLLREAGVRLSQEAAKGYSITARGSGTLPRSAFYLAEAKVGCSTFGDTLRIAGVFDLTGFDLTLRRKRIDAIVSNALPYLHDWRPDEVELEWAGLRPYPPDGIPVLGPAPGHDRLWIATGHGRMGITLGPPTGDLLAEAILEGARPPELEPFRLERFTSGGASRSRAGLPFRRSSA
ncbi:MAG: NAD(P)/FAD-dependent oxidoreductase [Gaiellaceae bacterium]